MNELLRWETDGSCGESADGRLTGLALTYLANLCAILALGAVFLFLASTMFVIKMMIL